MDDSERTQVETAMELGFPSMAVIAGQHQISKSSLYRHRAHLNVVSDVLVVKEYLENPGSFVERLAEIADDMRDVRRGAVAMGNVLNSTRAADSETRALNLLSERLGIDSTDVADTLRQGTALYRIVGSHVRHFPEVGRALAQHARQHHEVELANELEQVLQEEESQKGITS